MHGRCVCHVCAGVCAGFVSSVRVEFVFGVCDGDIIVRFRFCCKWCVACWTIQCVCPLV